VDSTASSLPPSDSADLDQAVIDRVLAGDRDAFGILIER